MSQLAAVSMFMDLRSKRREGDGQRKDGKKAASITTPSALHGSANTEAGFGNGVKAEPVLRKTDGAEAEGDP